MAEVENTKIWDLYQKGVNHHTTTNLYQQSKENWNFYNDDQWADFFKKGKKEDLPCYNMIKGMVDYKTAMIAKNTNKIVFSTMSDEAIEAAYTEMFTKVIETIWEKTEMDYVTWDVVKRAGVDGSSYIYSYMTDKYVVDTATKKMQLTIGQKIVNTTNIYFADETSKDIDEQEWIIISGREFVSKIRRIAKENGLSDEEIAKIVSDEDLEDKKEDTKEQDKSELGKCTIVLYMELTKEGLKYCRSTQGTIYEPEKLIPGLDVYPVNGYIIKPKIDSARGIGLVKPVIANQKWVNKGQYMFLQATQLNSYPTTVYDINKLENPELLKTFGATIGVENLGENDVRKVVSYLQPPAINPSASTAVTNMLAQTQQLEGAGDAAKGQIDPSQASGEAIRATIDQAAMMLNEPMAAYKQFIERWGIKTSKLLVAYCKNGIELEVENTITDPFTGDTTLATQKVPLTREEMQAIDINIRVDVSPTNQYSIRDRDNYILQMFQMGKIELEELPLVLSNGTNFPKAEIEKLIKARQEKQEQLAEQQQVQMLPEMEGLNEMSQMPM